jgi:hypothetical protein
VSKTSETHGGAIKLSNKRAAAASRPISSNCSQHFEHYTHTHHLPKFTMQLPMDGRRWLFSGAPMLRMRITRGLRFRLIGSYEIDLGCEVLPVGMSHLRKYAATSFLPWVQAPFRAVRPQLHASDAVMEAM